MNYRGYRIQAEVRCYERWSLTEDGKLHDFIDQVESSIEESDITYVVFNRDGDYVGSYDEFELAKESVDSDIIRLKEGKTSLA